MRSHSAIPVPADAFVDDGGGWPDGAGVALVMPFVLLFWSVVAFLLHG